VLHPAAGDGTRTRSAQPAAGAAGHRHDYDEAVFGRILTGREPPAFGTAERAAYEREEREQRAYYDQRYGAGRAARW
jgi:hypothetical protein